MAFKIATTNVELLNFLFGLIKTVNGKFIPKGFIIKKAIATTFITTENKYILIDYHFPLHHNHLDN